MSTDVSINKLKLKNPILTASGTFGYGAEYKDLVDLNGLGAIIVKGISVQPSQGNAHPRVVETPSGLLNSVGLENVGIKNFIKDKLPFLQELTTNVFVNIYGKSVEEYAELASIIDDLDGICGIEVNISCPNVKKGGAAFGIDPESASQVVHQVRKSTLKHVMVKLTPNVTDITKIALSVEAAGADSVSVINTLAGIAVDIDTFKPMLANVIGGLSGPAIKPVALKMVWQVANAVNIPVIGVGGISNARDAIEFIIAGATAVQVGTATLADPSVLSDIINGIEHFLKKKKISNLAEIRGCLKI